LVVMPPPKSLPTLVRPRNFFFLRNIVELKSPSILAARVYNDVWRFDLNTKMWSWIAGDGGVPNPVNPASVTSLPGVCTVGAPIQREFSIAWMYNDQLYWGTGGLTTPSGSGLQPYLMRDIWTLGIGSPSVRDCTVQVPVAPPVAEPEPVPEPEPEPEPTPVPLPTLPTVSGGNCYHVVTGAAVGTVEIARFVYSALYKSANAFTSHSSYTFHLCSRTLKGQSSFKAST
jgi:hypothetical protein